VTHHIPEVYPKSIKGWSATVEPLQNDFLNRDTRRALWMLLGAVGSCYDDRVRERCQPVLARGTVRQKESRCEHRWVRRRGQLFSQFLTESLALAADWRALGVGLAWALLQIIVALMPPFHFGLRGDVRLNVPVCSLLWERRCRRRAFWVRTCIPSSAFELNETLKEGGRTGVSAGGTTCDTLSFLPSFPCAYPISRCGTCRA